MDVVLYIYKNNKYMKLHPNAKDLTGKTFGKLTVIKPVPRPDTTKSKERSIFWFCKCECGNNCTVRSAELLVGDTKSCGCNRYMSGENSPIYKGVGMLSSSKFTHIKYAAIKRNLEFNVSMEYLWDLFQKQEGKCYYTGDLLTLVTRNTKGGMTASLDRLDSSKGYFEGNVVWSHKDINIMKMDKSEEEFYKLCQKVITHRKNQNL
jgi:hypothetical protein